jgi:hypothetical protein
MEKHNFTFTFKPCGDKEKTQKIIEDLVQYALNKVLAEIERKKLR